MNFPAAFNDNTLMPGCPGMDAYRVVLHELGVYTLMLLFTCV